MISPSEQSTVVSPTATETVLAFWQSMQSNDFAKAAQWLTDDFECHWQQTNERIVGRDNFVAINTAYPAKGRWHFTVNRIVTEGDQVVTEVDITDGHIQAKAITFHTVRNAQIKRQIEFWVDNYDAPQWRAPWVKPLK